MTAINTLLISLLAIAAALPVTAQDAEAEASIADAGPTIDYAVLVSGINGAPEEQQRKDRALLQLERALLSMGVPDQNIVVLADAQSLVATRDHDASAQNIEQAIQGLAQGASSDSTVLFYYAGQTNVVGEVVRLNLRGPDVTHSQLVDWLDTVQAQRFLMVFDCPCAGVFIEPLTGPGRIILCAARVDQPYSTRFSDFFVPAWTSLVADANSDGRVSLLEAFRYASEQVDALYDEADLRKTEIPLLEDNGDGTPSQRPWAFVSDAQDGAAAAEFVVR
jgi:hypothetical protein